jgi:hypothetical protein
MFVMAGVTAAELAEYALEQGITINLGEDEKFVAIRVLVMGWSWAPWVAQTALGALMDRLFNPVSGGARLIHRIPVPRFGPTGSVEDVRIEAKKMIQKDKDAFSDQYKIIDFLYVTQAVFEFLTFAFIDDYGIFKLIPVDGVGVEEEMKGLGKIAADALRVKGFDPHKEGVAEGLEKGLGVSIVGRPYVLIVDVNKMRETRGATRHVLRMRKVSPSAIEALMGSWSWIIQTARVAYSIPQATYALVHQCRHGSPMELWAMVRKELWTLLMVSPFIRTCLEAGWMSTVFAGDSSNAGAGVVQTEATIEEILAESRFAAMSGWPIADITRVYDLSEAEAWAPDAGPPRIEHEFDREEESPPVDWVKEVTFERPRVEAFGKRKPPAVGRNWDRLDRWALTWKSKWAVQEHINIQELRVIAGIGRRLSMSRRAWGKKVLVLSDSSAALGATMKGRSSVYPLLRQCRVLAAIGLALGIRISVRWVPSERNASDGPSRGLRIGAAPETLKAHADRLPGDGKCSQDGGVC